MTTIKIDATTEDLAGLAQAAGVQEVKMGGLSDITLQDGEDGAILYVPFSFLEEGDYEVRDHGQVGSLNWLEVSQARLRGFFHKMLPGSPKRFDVAWMKENLETARRKLYGARDELELTAQFLAAALAEGDEDGATLVARLISVAQEAEEILKDISNRVVKIDYKVSPPAQRLVKFSE